MKFKITSIRDNGDLAKERVVLKAEVALDIGEYMLAQSGYKDESVTNRLFFTFWFPDKEVSAGDFIVLYTKAGKDIEKQFKEVKSHFFYLGRTQPIWQEKDRSAVLFHAPEWDSFRG